MSYPRCFNSQKAYDAWAYYADRSKVSPNWPCIDCSAAYQARMVSVGRCKHPDATPGEPKVCRAPSATAKPGASSGKTPLAGVSPESCNDSARIVAKSSTTKTSTRVPKARAGARNHP